jgi:hypothetical protein
MRIGLFLAGALAPAVFLASPAAAESLVWGIQVEQLEYRAGDDSDVFAWDFDAIAGTDELKFVGVKPSFHSTRKPLKHLKTRHGFKSPYLPFLML